MTARHVNTRTSRRGKAARAAAARPAPLTGAEVDELESLLEQVKAPLEPLDVSTLDGFLCGVLVQPEPIPAERWLLRITDIDGRALPKEFDATRMHALARRRHDELANSIAARQWFDPWVFELADAADDSAGGERFGDGAAPLPNDPVYPWVAGFAAALETFPALLEDGGAALNEPLALLYRHLDRDDLEDAEALLDEIDATEPPVDLTEAVENLVRATLLLADAAAATHGRRR